MAQHDYNLSNNTGALYRADNNSALQAIVTQNSGANAPAVTFPGMIWLDMSGGGDGVYRRRNAANTAWLTDIGQDQIARDAAAAAQATANAAMPKAGGTFTGPIILPGTVPTNNQAVSRAQADLLYQVVLPTPVAGSLLVGAAGGWQSMLAPAANDTILALSGGLPTWTSTAVAAAPNQIVRTKADGTIDASFIPSVASGLRFRGTFRPAVNAEYPTTGGSGAGGAPAVGDFWVIDGLTTGGYTFLTGTLAGVTVYNGDSIAKSDGANWYRMGSSVDIEGVIKSDGSVAMAADFNMGAHSIVEVGGIVARAGTPVPLNNFSIDASNVVVSPQRGTTGADLPALATGQIGTDLGRMTIFVGASGVNTSLLAVRFFSPTAAYAQGVYVVNGNGGPLVRAKAAISAGAFTPSQWSTGMDSRGGTFTAPITVDSTSAQYIFKNGSWTYNFALGADGKFYLSDTANSTYAWFYEASMGTRFRGRVMADTDVSTKSGFFYSEAGHAVVAINTTTAAPGVIYFRPNGINEALGQFIIRGDSGRMECYGDILSGGKVSSQTGVFTSNISSLVLSTASAGGIYLRPNGPGSAAGEFAILPTGQVSCAGVFYNATGEFRSTIASCVLSANNGLMYFRPQGGTGAQAYINNSNGDMAIAGTMYAANIPGSDERLKEHINDVATRDLSALPFKSFNFIGKDDPQRGPIAQDVLMLAPEYVIAYDTIDPTLPPESFADGEAPPLVSRYTLNYGGLAIEMALNALQRIAEIEAALAAPIEKTTRSN
jgi:hypothetical protein